MVDVSILRAQSVLQILNTINPAFFPENIKAAIRGRQDERATQKEDYIVMTAGMQWLFQSSHSISKCNNFLADLLGARDKGLALLKKGVKPRKKAQRQPPRHLTFDITHKSNCDFKLDVVERSYMDMQTPELRNRGNTSMVFETPVSTKKKL